MIWLHLWPINVNFWLDRIFPVARKDGRLAWRTTREPRSLPFHLLLFVLLLACVWSWSNSSRGYFIFQKRKSKNLNKSQKSKFSLIMRSSLRMRSTCPNQQCSLTFLSLVIISCESISSLCLFWFLLFLFFNRIHQPLAYPCKRFFSSTPFPTIYKSEVQLYFLSLYESEVQHSLPSLYGSEVQHSFHQYMKVKSSNSNTKLHPDVSSPLFSKWSSVV